MSFLFAIFSTTMFQVYRSVVHVVIDCIVVNYYLRFHRRVVYVVIDCIVDS